MTLTIAVVSILLINSFSLSVYWGVYRTDSVRKYKWILKRELTLNDIKSWKYHVHNNGKQSLILNSSVAKVIDGTEQTKAS